MKRTATIALGTALMLGTSGLAFAGSMNRPNTNPNSASTFAPGQSKVGAPQAVAPGQIQKESMGTTRASDVAPGQLKKGSTTGSMGGAPTQRR